MPSRLGRAFPFARNPRSYASFADFNNDDFIGSSVNSSLVNDSANTSSGSSLPVSFLNCTLNSFIACSLLLLIHCVSLTYAVISFLLHQDFLLDSQVLRLYELSQTFLQEAKDLVHLPIFYH